LNPIRITLNPGNRVFFMSYSMYILYSKTSDRFYIGHTGDVLEERIRKHNSNHGGFTGRSTDWKLVYKEVFATKLMSFKREMEIKAWKSRKRIEALIKPGE